MTSRYKAYPEYKESGVEWIKEIPSYWFISDLRRGIDFLTDFEANGSFSDVKKNVDLDADGKYAWYLRATDLQSGRVGFDTGNRTVDEKAYNFLKKTTLYGGELLVAKRGEIGKVYLVPKLNCKATLAPNLYLIRLNQLLSPKFSLYWFLSSFGKPQLELANKSTTIGALYKDDVRTCQIVYPSFEEQQKIANFLDHETTKIDTLIAKQETLIELLKEKRQAVISHAVTKGLNPDAPMKDSGVEWLGEVPAHWVVSKFAYLKTVLTDYTANGSFADLKANVEYRDSPSFARLVRLTDLRFDLHNDNGVWIDEGSYKYLRKSALYGGEFLLANVGAYAGLFYQMPFNKGPASLAPNMFMAKFNTNKVKREFMAYAGQSDVVASQLKLSATAASAQPKLNKDDFKGVIFTYPNMEEQQQIVDYLNAELPKLDLLMSKQTKAIKLMKERKTALISAAVTGKIDVRDWESK